MNRFSQGIANLIIFTNNVQYDIITIFLAYLVLSTHNAERQEIAKANHSVRCCVVKVIVKFVLGCLNTNVEHALSPQFFSLNLNLFENKRNRQDPTLCEYYLI